MQRKMEDSTCEKLPSLLSSFVDTFVDFSVSGGLFLPPTPPPQLKQEPVVESPPHKNPYLNPSISSPTRSPIQTRYPSPERLVAVGDVHGDMEKLKESLRLAGLIDPSDRWSGGNATVVQVGDVLDRGGEEIKILYFLEKLKRQAAEYGGTIITMNGNHEILNIDCDFRYVTSEGLDEFKNWGFWYQIGIIMKSSCSSITDLPGDPFDGVPIEFRRIKKEFHEGFRARIAALRPNGPISTRFLSDNPTVLVMGDNVFVHGGLLPSHVEYGLERINEEIRDWINGRRNLERKIGRTGDSPVWLRKYSHNEAEKCDCSMLEHVLATIPGARRMIMGHTIQVGGINGVCGNKAIRIDVGMSKGCENGLPEVLEIGRDSGNLRVLTSNPLYKEKKRDEQLARTGGGKDDLQLLKEIPRQVEVRA